MSADENRISSSQKKLELRVIIIGEIGVGKKSLTKRFKMLKSTSTKEREIDDFYTEIKKKKKNTKLTTMVTDPNSESQSQTIYRHQEQTEDYEDEETKERERQAKRREEKRVELLKFEKIYEFGFNHMEITYYPCAEPVPFPPDYEPKEEDENFEFEKAYRISLSRINKELIKILMMPPQNNSSYLEYLIILCFDLSNFGSFEKMVVYLSQIGKQSQINFTDYKMILVGNKLDKKKNLNDEQKDALETFRNKLGGLKYYEVSSLMFFNFEKFFETILYDNFGDLPIFEDPKARKKLHDILTAKQSFSQTKRPEFGGSNCPGPNQYKSNAYQYPTARREMKKLFKDRYKYNKYIFINKNGILFPPIKVEKEKDFNINGIEVSASSKTKKKDKDNLSQSKKKDNDLFSWDVIQNKELKSNLELTSSKPGYTLGIKTCKPLGLKEDRKKKINKINSEISNAFGSGIRLNTVSNFNESRGSLSQEKYAFNRTEKKKNCIEESKKKEKLLKERHEGVLLKNNSVTEEKINSILKREEKYTKKFEEKIKKENQKKNEINKSLGESNITKVIEPPGKFYDPVPSISTNKGFTFGQKLAPKEKASKEGPEFNLVKDDFERLIEKNEKNKNNKTMNKLAERFPKTKCEQVGDSSYLMEKQKDFEIRRRNFKKNTFTEFFEDRKNKKDRVIENKSQIKIQQENDLKDQIIKTYNVTDGNNYLIRNINYDQVENASPKFSMKGRYEIGSIFQQDKNINATADHFNRNNFLSILSQEDKANSVKNLEKPNIAVIRPKYPAFSFGQAHRFDFNIDEARNTVSGSVSNDKWVDPNRNNSDLEKKSMFFSTFQETQSFLKTQTSLGTAPKLVSKANGFPGPGMYKLKGFADDVVKNGDIINKTRMTLNERAKYEEMEKLRRLKNIEQWNEDRKIALKMSIKDSNAYFSQRNSQYQNYNYNEDIVQKTEQGNSHGVLRLDEEE